MEPAVSIRKILRFLIYSLFVLGVLLCGMDVALGQAEQVVGIIYGIGLWVLILKVVQAVLGRVAHFLESLQRVPIVASLDATPRRTLPDDDDRPRLKMNPATGWFMVNRLTDGAGNPYGVNWDD